MFTIAAAKKKVPDAWDDTVEEDWEKLADLTDQDPSPPPPKMIIPTSSKPNPRAPAFNPPSAPRLYRPESAPTAPPLLPTAAADPFLTIPVVISATAQPRTFYKPELKILKRSSLASSPEPQSRAGAAGRGGGGGGKQETEEERRERARKEREKRYKEAREKIFGEGVENGGASGGSEIRNSSPAAGENRNGKGKKGKSGKGGGGGGGNAKATGGEESSASSSSSAKVADIAEKPPTPKTRKASPPRPTGAITSLSLNGGEFIAPPAPGINLNSTWAGQSNWAYRQRELDGKLLESQVQAQNGDNPEPLEGEPEGLDWDSFSRDPTIHMRTTQAQQGYGERGYPPVAPPLSNQMVNGGGYEQVGYYLGYSRDETYTPGFGTQTYQQPYFETDPFVPRSTTTAAAAATTTAVVAEKERNPRHPGFGTADQQQPSRAPRGPDAAGGRGFGAFRGGLARVRVNSTRDRLMNGVAGLRLDAKEFVPGSSGWGR